MGNAEYLGELEQIVLLAVMQLRENAYGVTIREEILNRIGRDVSYGALYTTLERLKQKGYLSVKKGPSSPTRGGRAKQFYRIQAPGVRVLSEKQDAINKMSHNLSPLTA